MKRMVAPQSWTARHAVEQPPLMLKPFVQGICGGVRWLETKALAEHMARRALGAGYARNVVSPRAARALGVDGLRRTTTGKRRARVRTCNATTTTTASTATTTTRATPPVPVAAHKDKSSDALLCVGASSSVSPAAALVPVAPRRLVSYDVLDCTFGSGYHTGAVLANGAPYTRVVALDCDAATSLPFARQLAREFGGDRLRFFGSHRMSQTLSLFGEAAFDAVVIDPGPSFTQLEDVTRGFALHGDNDHALDLRYSASSGVDAARYVNTVPQHALAKALASYALLTPEQAMKLARAVRHGLPYSTMQSLMRVVEAAGCELPEEGWYAQHNRRTSPLSWKFAVSLRCIVNAEREELTHGVQNAMLLLRDEGRLVVFTRLAWEEALVRQLTDTHPYALECYTERIDAEAVQAHGHSRHTIMWVIVRSKKATYALKNRYTLTDEQVQRSSLQWMHGTYAGQTSGFPAQNATFARPDAEERATRQRNTQPPPFDDGSNDTDRRRWRLD